MLVRSADSTCPISAVTATKTSSGGAPRATSVATRRSAACSSDSRAAASAAFRSRAASTPVTTAVTR